MVDAHRLEAEFDMAVLDRIHHDIESGIIPAGTGVSINVSGVSIVTQNITDKLLTFAKFLDRYQLVVEITETALITHITHASSNLNQLRKAGFVQDHSMLTAMLAVDNIVAGRTDDTNLWDVNLEEEYHEEHAPKAADAP